MRFLLIILCFMMCGCTSLAGNFEISLLSNEYLSRPNLVVELMHIGNAQPQYRDIENFRLFAEQITCNNVFVKILPVDCFTNQYSWTIDRLLYAVYSRRETVSTDNTSVMYVLCVRGYLAEESYKKSVVLGIALERNIFVIFSDPFATYDNTGLVMSHEFCHLIGLVNCGLRMISYHEKNHHCVNKQCFMYYKANPLQKSLCKNCIEDIRGMTFR